MRIVAEVPALRGAEPACVAGPGWIYFRWSPSLTGMTIFGRPTAREAEALAHALSLEFEPGVAPHAFYVDAQQLEGADPDAFSALVAVYRKHFDRASAIYTKLGLVVPGGVEGAIVAGFHGGRAPPFPVRASADGVDIRAWLDAPSALHDALTAIVAEQRAAPPLLLSLRTLLAAEQDVDAEALARKLGLSSRTLQRRLADAGTTLQTEITRHRVTLAQKRLTQTETPITAIALDLGFSTSQHFSRTFRELTGVTPTAWRARRERHR